jgi:hypothetical protein
VLAYLQVQDGLPWSLRICFACSSVILINILQVHCKSNSLED